MSALTAREVKNKVINQFPKDEREDHIVGDTRYGYMIVTDKRVVEVYESGGFIYVQERNLQSGEGWEILEIEGDD